MSYERVDWLVVGLGNPGARYAGTRHNVGFEVASKLATEWGFKRAKSCFGGLFTSGRVQPERVSVGVLLPQTFMNLSGRSVSPAVGSLKLPLDRLLILHDEIDLEFGEIRSRAGGGLAGHNGLKSIAQELGSRDFLRIRIGVGRPQVGDQRTVSDYVLGRFDETDEQVGSLVEAASAAAKRTILRDL